MPHNHYQMANSIIIWITCKQVSSKNKFAQCAQEWDVTYTLKQINFITEMH
jgi:hypothetical protein